MVAVSARLMNLRVNTSEDKMKFTDKGTREEVNGPFRYMKKAAVGLVLAFALLAGGLNDVKGLAVAPKPSLTLTLGRVKPFDLEPMGMAKPIADLRDYNGTYTGTPGTGTIGYASSSTSVGTLYRDNEDGGTSTGCNGEGCGSHPGVDIPVTSGTRVYATRSGTVVRAECNSGWGGLVVIRSTNPYDTSKNIYFTYDHLRDWVVGKGWRVNTGDLIGYSGSGTDYCKGRSTGAHLHYQIDKDDGNDEPWFPSNVNVPNSLVTEKTYNPIVFAVGGIKWTFWQPGFNEWWVPVNVTSSGVSDGALWIDGAFDPYIQRGGNNVSCGLPRPCRNNISIEASLYPRGEPGFV